MAIEESETHFYDQFHWSAGVFESAWSILGYKLMHKLPSITFLPTLYDDRQAAHQAIGDQQTGLLAWDSLPRAKAVKELQNGRWVRLPITFNKINGEPPHDLPDYEPIEVPSEVLPKIAE